jgi:hypothetical protein
LIVGRSTIRVPDQIKFEGNIVDTSKPKPDLMGAAAASAGGGKRILAHLEHGAKPAAKPGRVRTAGWTIDGWTVGVVFLLILILSVAWLVREETIPQSSVFKHDSNDARAPAATTRSEAMPLDASPAELADKSTGVDGQAATTGQTETTGQAAAIINEAGASPSAQAHAATAPVTQSATAAAGVTEHPGAIASAATTMTTVTITAPPRASASAASSVLAKAEHPRPAAPAARKQTGATGTNENSARTAATAAASAARAPGDSDVALLTALVAHANKPAIVVPERSRDIVERQETDTTVQLLVRCKQLGLIEGMLCRSRICSGRWEADAACRAPAH